jgi:predicted  nucleic acid-binding Zn-ribbon protein
VFRREKRCLKCGEVFVPGIGGVNLVVITLRQCPHCGKMTNISAKEARVEPKKEKDKLEELNEEELLKRRIEESKYSKD